MWKNNQYCLEVWNWWMRLYVLAGAATQKWRKTTGVMWISWWVVWGQTNRVSMHIRQALVLPTSTKQTKVTVTIHQCTTTTFYTQSYHPTWIAITIHDVCNYHIYYMQVTMQKAFHLPCISSQKRKKPKKLTALPWNLLQLPHSLHKNYHAICITLTMRSVYNYQQLIACKLPHKLTYSKTLQVLHLEASQWSESQAKNRLLVA